MNRALIAALFFSLFASLASAADGGQQPAPNILFIAVDDLRPMGAAFGDDRAQTPNIDTLAAGSTVFTRAYVQYPVCGPSRASMLTGLRPESSGVLDLKTRLRDIHPDIVTLPQFFLNNGYETAAVGKIFDPRSVDSRQTDDPASWSIPFKSVSGTVDKQDGKRYAAVPIAARNEAFIDGQINARGRQLLRQMAAGDKPFFLGVGYKKPHLPFTVPKRFFDQYDRQSLDLEPFQTAPEGSNPQYILSGNTELRSYVPQPATASEPDEYGEVLTEDQQRELLQGYFAAVSFIDELIGDLLAELESTGEADNTIIVFWGDHGFHLGDHGVWGKHTTMEQAARHPLMIRVPGRDGIAVHTVVEALDIYPTLLELAGFRVPDHLQGQSLLPEIKGEQTEGTAVTMYRRVGAYGYSLRSDRFRYTEWVKPDGSVAYRDLYDMHEDPGERRNIADEPDMAGKLDSLAGILRSNEGLLRLNARKDDAAPTLVFLLAGQSNMDGRGDGSKLTDDDLMRLEAVKDRVHFAYNGADPRPLDVTIPLGHIARKFELERVFGPELFFGIRAAEAFPDREILLIKRSLGGTSLYGAWHPDWSEDRATLMNEADRPRLFGELVGDVERVLGDRPAASYDFGGALWVQGETDSNTKRFGNEPAESYGENLTQLIHAIREITGDADLPFHMLQVGGGAVVAGMKDTAQHLDKVYFIPQSQDPESDRYLPKYGPPVGHYDYEGMKRIGNLFADSVL